MGGVRDRWRLVTSVHHAFYRWVAAPALLLFSLRRWDTAVPTAVEAFSIIGLTLPQGDPSGGTNGDGSGGGFFFPLSEALASVMRLAVDDVNAGGVGALTEGNLTLSVFGVNTGTRVMEGLCDALEFIGEKGGTFGIVGPMLSSQASLLETMSNNVFGLPLVTPSASAARAVTYFDSRAQGLGAGPSFLFGTQPDIFEQMEALARLVLDMKAQRDAVRGWIQSTERVSVIYPDGGYGPIAASAFARAVRSTIGVNIDYSGAARPFPSTIDIGVSMPVTINAGTDFQPVLRSLIEQDASIIVLLAEGFDGTFIRSVLVQARDMGLVNKNIQWYLNGETAMDGIFTVNDTHHDSELAFDLRGTLGVRACPPIEGPGSDQILALTSRWESLNSDVYPGAGPGTLTPDGRLDPLLAYAYDSVFALAGGIGAEQTTAKSWGASLHGFVTESCPFRTEGLWEDGEFIRKSTLEVDFVGVTGNVKFIGGENLVTNGAGTAGSGWRDGNQTTFCGVNLQPYAPLGATFATMWTWRPEQSSDTTHTSGFEKLDPLQKEQTYPAGGAAYPFDRPTINNAHFEVITEETVVPFAIITGQEATSSAYKGISLDMMQELSRRMGFTYNISVADSSISQDSVVTSVADGTFDMAASSITITAPRMDSVSFSHPYYSTSLSFVYRKVTDKASLWHMFGPFENSVWVAVFVATAVVFVLLWVFDGTKMGTDKKYKIPQKAGRYRTKSNHNPDGRRQLVKGIGLSIFATGSLLMGQMAYDPTTLESHVLTSGWLFASFIIAAAFTAQLASTLSKERMANREFAVDDLRKGAVPHSQVALLQGQRLQTFYQEEIMDCYSQQDCYGGPVANTPVLCYTLDECLALVAEGTCVTTVLDSATAAYQVANDFCGLDILPDIFNVEEYGLVLEKDSPFIGDFRQAILRLSEDGTMAEIAARYFDASPCASLDTGEYVSTSLSENLTLVETRCVFLIYGIFVALSLVSWMFGGFVNAKKKLKRQLSRREWWQSGKVHPRDPYGLRRNASLDTLQGGTTPPDNTEDASDGNTNGRPSPSTRDPKTPRVGNPWLVRLDSQTRKLLEGTKRYRRSPPSS